MNSLVKNEDRQWYEACRVEAQRAEKEGGNGREGGGAENRSTFLESTFGIIDAASCVRVTS